MDTISNNKDKGYLKILLTICPKPLIILSQFFNINTAPISLIMIQTTL